MQPGECAGDFRGFDRAGAGLRILAGDRDSGRAAAVCGMVCWVLWVMTRHAHDGLWQFFGRGAFAPGQGWWPKWTKSIYARNDFRGMWGQGVGEPDYLEFGKGN